MSEETEKFPIPEAVGEGLFAKNGLNPKREDEGLSEGVREALNRRSKVLKKAKRERWQDRYKRRVKIRNFTQIFTKKWTFLRNNVVNLQAFNTLLTQLFSLFTFGILAYSMYLVVGHIKIGNWEIVVAATVFISVMAWLNTKTGVSDGQDE